MLLFLNRPFFHLSMADNVIAFREREREKRLSAQCDRSKACLLCSSAANSSNICPEAFLGFSCQAPPTGPKAPRTNPLSSYLPPECCFQTPTSLSCSTQLPQTPMHHHPQGDPPSEALDSQGDRRCKIQ